MLLQGNLEKKRSSALLFKSHHTISMRSVLCNLLHFQFCLMPNAPDVHGLRYTQVVGWICNLLEVLCSMFYEKINNFILTISRLWPRFIPKTLEVELAEIWPQGTEIRASQFSTKLYKWHFYQQQFFNSIQFHRFSVMFCPSRVQTQDWPINKQELKLWYNERNQTTQNNLLQYGIQTSSKIAI